MNIKDTGRNTPPEMLDAQKELIDYTMKKSFEYSMKNLFVVLVVTIVVFASLLFLFYTYLSPALQK